MTPDPLTRVDHRPWPVPRRPWIMRQTWESLAFVHWPVPIEAVRRLVPASVEIDTFAGSAWIGIVPFNLRSLRLRGAPPIPGVRRFLELNVRTYVTRDGKPGVWFLSLDADRSLAVWFARRWYRLPYHRADIRRRLKADGMEFTSVRRNRADRLARFSARFTPNDGTSDNFESGRNLWLTERYCLYARDAGGRVFRADIHHVPWTLHPAKAEIAENGMVAALGIRPPPSPPIVHLAETIEALIWSPVRVT